MTLSGNTLYGTAGTVFKLSTDGTGFTTLHAGSDGAYPHAGLLLSGSTLYGMAEEGGSSGSGTVFKLSTDGTGFMNLYSFTALSCLSCPNSDGSRPYAGLTLSGNTLYGTAQFGGSSGSGTVFAVNTDGTGFANLYTFTATDPNTGINSDGAYPHAGLILSGSTLYGTAEQGGSGGSGTVFSLSLPVTPPQLTIASSGAYVILTWPTNAAGFTLQSTTNLVSPALWTTNSLAPVVVNGQNEVTNPISGTRKFYRLSQ